jgi:hypothetical protein
MTKLILVFFTCLALSGCAGKGEMLQSKPDLAYDTSMAPDDIRDCIINLHNDFNYMEQTKQEITFSSTAVRGYYTPYYVIRITPRGSGSHVDVHFGLGGSVMYGTGGKSCIDKLPPL